MFLLFNSFASASRSQRIFYISNAHGRLKRPKRDAEIKSEHPCLSGTCMLCSSTEHGIFWNNNSEEHSALSVGLMNNLSAVYTLYSAAESIAECKRSISLELFRVHFERFFKQLYFEQNNFCLSAYRLFLRTGVILNYICIARITCNTNKRTLDHVACYMILSAQDIPHTVTD